MQNWQLRFMKSNPLFLVESMPRPSKRSSQHGTKQSSLNSKDGSSRICRQQCQYSTVRGNECDFFNRHANFNATCVKHRELNLRQFGLMSCDFTRFVNNKVIKLKLYWVWPSNCSLSRAYGQFQNNFWPRVSHVRACARII